MATVTIKKGYDLKLDGAPEKTVFNAPQSKTVAFQPTEFKGLKPRLLVKEGDSVEAGTPLFADKQNPDTLFVSPVSGKVREIRIGERRSLQAVIIEVQGEEAQDFGQYDSNQIAALSREDSVAWLQRTGQFIHLLQRPFDKIPDLNHLPKSIFINAMDSAPGALDQDVILEDRIDDLNLGIQLLSRLTEGVVNLCHQDKGDISPYEKVTHALRHTFCGPHPSGLVGTHIHFVDPIQKGQVIWYLTALQAASIGKVLRTGKVDADRIIAISGSGIQKPGYYKTKQGASIDSLLEGLLLDGDTRIIGGTALYGDTLERKNHLPFYGHNLQVIPEGRERKFLGWAMPGLDALSISSRSFLSCLFPNRTWNLDTNIHGGHRTIVWTDVYDQVMPLDILTNFLIKAILAEDIEEAENLGILEVGGEDFALATYLCPSKIDISNIIERGLAIIEQEGY